MTNRTALKGILKLSPLPHSDGMHVQRVVPGPSAVAFAQDPYANAPAYVSVKVIQPLVTTGQQVPLAGSTSQKYLFVGIPDGMGVYSTNQGGKVGQFKLTVNHELRPT